MPAWKTEEPLTAIGSAFNLFTGAAAGAVGELAGGFAANFAARQLGSIAGAIASRNDQDRLYPAKAFEYLKELRDNRIPFNIVTRLETYTNMMLTRLSVPQAADEGRSLRFQATFEQIQIVRTRTLQIPEAQTQTGAVKKEDTGKQTGTEEDIGSTTLFDLTGKLAGIRESF